MENQAHTLTPSIELLNKMSQPRFGIARRLFLAFSVIGVLSGCISFVGWSGLQAVNETQTHISKQNLPAIRAAMTLATKTSLLVASAPLLEGANTPDARENHYLALKKALGEAHHEVEMLTPLVPQDQGLTSLQSYLQRFPALIEQLNDLVDQRLTLTEHKSNLTGQLVSLRVNASEYMEPLVSEIDSRVMQNIDGWYFFIKEKGREILAGQEPDYDISDLEEATFATSAYQTAVGDFKSSVYLLSGFLLQAAQSSSIEDVKKLGGKFYSSLAAMSGPLSQLQQSGEKEELSQLFNALLKLGDKGEVRQNIFKLRQAELELQAQSLDILTQARALSQSLSSQVRSLVQELEVKTNEDIANNEVLSKKVSYFLVGVTLLSAVIIAAIVWFYVHGNLIRRLSQLGDGMGVIAQGDLSVRVDRRGQDEISRMGVALALLRNGLREAEELKKGQEALRQKSDQEKKEHALKLADEFDAEIGRSLGAFSEYIGDIKQRSETMSEVLNVTQAETSEVAQASEIMAQNVASVSDSADQLATAITEISAQVNQGTKVSDEAVAQAEELKSTITRLHSSSEQIEQVVSLISQIAEQTNLLALNATIEASRAGNAGKGFAVVASEVKTLANQTTHAIDSINDLIGAVQLEVSAAVRVTDHMGDVIGNMDEISIGIAGAVEEQSAATGVINSTVQNVADRIQDINQRVQQVSNGIEENAQMIGDVLDGVSHLDDQGKMLNGNVERFISGLR